MTKAELTDKIAQRTGGSIKDTAEFINAFVEEVSESLAAGEEVVLTGFGKFYVSQKKERIGRNPRTGETLKIAAHKSPGFKVGVSLREKVNQ
ncbi:MAG: hypothetical protein GWP10_06260 [Nitrospiraceae bacterium]|nr:hypothetical protein [Nitrospiraceae bacterium]